MAQIRKSFMLAAAAAALVVGSATAATAAGTGIHSGSATGPLFGGNVKGSLLGTATVSTSVGGGSCNQSTMLGSVHSDGTALTINSATFTNNPGPACPGGGGTVTVTAQSLPWSGGNVTYDGAHTGGRDATVTIAGFKVRADASIFGGITCYYGGSVTANGYNPNNPNRPDTTVAQAQIKLANATINKISTGSNFLCPSTATVTAAYQLQGESSPGSGNYSLQLWVAAS
ncbi:hypothetical protein [Actinomadura rupiterrae]|uniref:hypothetical protein n=1 Tax=Actinomadura rupiterrae TaxID=559627 RepID=UPI0020A57B0F|nr:hypothetical protein [Actinomadura rupiterrae]MCP2338762.1 hypothetical protein [Actinomadura rupiterrae]